MNEKKKISIIGGTGNLGVPVVKFLLKSGFEIKLIARNIGKAKLLFEPNTKLQFIAADLKNVSELTKALSDTEYLYLNLSTQTTDINIPFSTEREGVKNILNAINREHIKQIITISGLGAFDNVRKHVSFEFIPNIIRKQGHKLLKNSGIPYTILHCSWFTDNFIIYRRNKVYSVIGNTTDPIYFVNCYDYTMHLINAIGNPKAFFKEFPIQGDKGFQHIEAAKAFWNAYSKPTQIKLLPANIIKLLALLSKEMKYVKHMNDYFTVSSESFLAKDYGTYHILGNPSLSITQYAEKLKKERVYDYLEVLDN